MNCNNCGVVIRQAGEECWSCGKMVDLSAQPLAQEPSLAFPAMNRSASQSTEGSVAFSPVTEMRLESRVPTSLGGESDAPAMDQVKHRKLEKKVRNACIVAVLAGLVALGAVATGYSELYAAVDAFIILALAYGIYKRNLASAVALIMYFAGDKIYAFLTAPETLSGASLPVSGLVVVYLIDGAIAIRTLRSSRTDI